MGVLFHNNNKKAKQNKKENNNNNHKLVAENEKEPLYSVLVKLGLDQLVFDPLVGNVFFYIAMGILERKSWIETKADLKKDFWVMQKMSW